MATFLIKKGYCFLPIVEKTQSFLRQKQTKKKQETHCQQHKRRRLERIVSGQLNSSMIYASLKLSFARPPDRKLPLKYVFLTR